MKKQKHNEVLEALKQAIETLKAFECEDVWYYEAVVKQAEKKTGIK